MNKKEFAQVMNYLYTAYGKEQNKLQLGVYYDHLGIYDIKSLMGAAKEWIRNSGFFPKIADLIKIIQNKEISFDQVMNELHQVISIGTGASFDSSDIHEVSYQILNELGGKFGISTMSEEELVKQVRMKYKYVVNEKILRLEKKDQKQIGRRTGANSLKTIMDNFPKRN